MHLPAQTVFKTAGFNHSPIPPLTMLTDRASTCRSGTLTVMRFRCWSLFLLAVTLPLLANCAKKPVTIDDMLAYHAASRLDPVWSPDGRTFAYEQDGAVYRYDIRHRKTKKIIQIAELERLSKPLPETNGFSWTNRRVFTDAVQWFPNGSDLLVLARGDLFLIRADGSKQQLTASAPLVEAPELSPDGQAVLFRSNHNLYLLDVRSQQARQLTTDGTATLLNGETDWVYPEELDLHKAAWWSPDGKRVAYLQFNVADEFVYPQTDLLGRRAVYEPQRYPQAGTPNAKVKLGVISADGGQTVWMQASDSPDTLMARVAWFPDSKSLALQTLPRLQNELDLLKCDAATGVVKELIHETSKDWVNLSSDPVFLKGTNEFLWLSERSGFRHIYRYSNEGQQRAQITSGDWEVKEVVAVNEHSHRVLFTGTADTPLETQLYEVPFDGGAPRRLTQPNFDHSVHVNETGEFYTDTLSNVATPPRTVLRNRSGDELSLLRKDDNPSDNYDFTTPQVLTFKADGVTFYGKLYQPANFDKTKKWPLIVHVYGGPGAQSVLNNWTGLSWEQLLCARGFLVWELDNRGSTGRGHAWEAPIFHNLGEQEVADQRRGVDYLKTLGFVDPDRVGVTGWSYGGYMTIHSMLVAPDLFKVGVAGAPVTDWHNYDTIYTERYMGLPNKNAHGYEESSNVENASELKGSLLIVHNFEDDNVLLQNTMQFANALDEENKAYSLNLYGQKTHHVAGRVQRQLYDTMTSFFERNLK